MKDDMRKKLSMFNSLMDTQFHTHIRTQEELLQELKDLEDQGKLRIYSPERERQAEKFYRSLTPEQAGAIAHGFPA